MEEKQLEKIEKIIESCHISFLIGSGTSRNYLDTLSNIEELLTELDQEPKNEILETSIKYQYFNNCIRGNLRLRGDFKLSKKKEIEYEVTRNSYLGFLKSLNIILLKRKTNLLNRQINLFTTNMDLFLDKTLDDLGIEFNDGFNGKFESVFSTSNYQKSFYKSSAQYDFKSELPLFNLFKLHGSVTWKQLKINKSENKIVYDSSLQTLKNLDKIKFIKNKDIVSDIESIAKIKRQITNLGDFPLDKHIKFLEEYKDLVMINPNKEKFESTTLRLEYYEQLRMYSNALEKENSVLFVCGFSFADEHIKEITLRVANSNPTLIIYVFCFDNGSQKDIENKLKKNKFNNIKLIVIGEFSNVVNNIFVKLASKLDSKSYKLAQEINDSTNITHLINKDGETK
jgi:hypothetical protein